MVESDLLLARRTHILRRVEAACRRSGRLPEHVRLVGATKKVPLEAIERAKEAGMEEFAENYARELRRKAEAIPARWHFIGKLQRGTASLVAKAADVIHSGEPGRGLEQVAKQAGRAGRQIEWLAQVDFTGRRQGVHPAGLDRFVEEASALAGLKLVGLMTLPPFSHDPEDSRAYFRRLRELRDTLQTVWPDLVELSMGMSGDYEVAVEEGATMVRVGTALFGERPGPQAPKAGASPTGG